jgi:hypothetical protein
MPLVSRLPMREPQPCGLCWYGKCMCTGVTDTTHQQYLLNKIVPACKSEPGLGYRGLAYTDPVARRLVDQDTAAFIAEMRRFSGRKVDVEGVHD